VWCLPLCLCRNYFSVGADAQAAYNFHHLRDQHPVLASNRVANQFWYSTFSCTSGWFCGSIPSVSSFSRVEVLQPGSSSWQPLAVPSSIKALVLVNLQSYGGGRNIWGEQPSKQAGRWRQPSFSDGLIEVGLLLLLLRAGREAGVRYAFSAGMQATAPRAA
jgi:diacylglycerol kinase (ATP)